MAGPQNYTHAEVKAGLFLAFCLALFCGMLLVYGHLSKFWRGRQELHVVFSSAGGLSPDAPVMYNGVEVGRVKQMQIIHMDRQQLRRLVPVTRAGLDHLPLTAAKRLELRLLPDEQFQEAVHEALRVAVDRRLAIELFVRLTVRAGFAVVGVQLNLRVAQDRLRRRLAGSLQCRATRLRGARFRAFPLPGAGLRGDPHGADGPGHPQCRQRSRRAGVSRRAHLGPDRADDQEGVRCRHHTA